MLAIPKPIAISNTGSSKHLRMAAAEAVIAKQLCERIFQPLYNLNSPVREELDDALEELFYKNPRQEAILRSSLLSAFVSEQQDHTKIVNSVVDDVCNLLGPLLFSQSDRDAFRSSLKVVLYDAAELWNRAQRSTKRVLASAQGKDWDWRSYQEHDDAVKLTAEQKALAHGLGEPLMILFPRVYFGDQSASIHDGLALWSDQSIVITGEMELREQVVRVNSRNEKIHSGSGKRRISIGIPPGSSLNNHQPGVLSSLPHSPTAGKRSFLERAKDLPGQSGRE